MLPFEPHKSMRTLKSFKTYLQDLSQFKRQQKSFEIPFKFGKPYPCLEDKFMESGIAKGHYFHQDLLAARRIYDNSPILHVDIGSRIDGFVSHVASFRKIEVFDIRHLEASITNIKIKCVDFMGTIDAQYNTYCDSLSCLHALEHFGLGRYGDPLMFDGYLKGLENIYNILKKNGKFYFSVPIGPQRIEFNAHRVFSVKHLLGLFNDKYRIDFFSYVDDKGDLHENAELNENEVDNNFGCNYGCGIFEMTKL
jgi:SAM-dependent methyltransferase